MKNEELTLERLLEEGRFNLIEDRFEEVEKRLQLLDGGARRLPLRIPEALSA